jgi:hypothetical protein
VPTSQLEMRGAQLAGGSAAARASSPARHLPLPTRIQSMSSPWRTHEATASMSTSGPLDHAAVTSDRLASAAIRPSMAQMATPGFAPRVMQSVSP